MAPTNARPVKSLEFHLPLPSTVYQTQMELVADRLRPAWLELGAERLTVKLDGNGLIQIRVYFNNSEVRDSARKRTSKPRMLTLISEGSDSSPASSTTSTDDSQRYQGPNGQPQKTIYYKPGTCPFGCSATVRDPDSHAASCVACKKYTEDRKKYENDEQRLKEQPSAFVRYEEHAIDGRKKESRFGYIYGQGPMLLKDVRLAMGQLNI